MKRASHISFEAKTELTTITESVTGEKHFWKVKDSHSTVYLLWQKNLVKRIERAIADDLRVLLSGQVVQKIGGTYLNIEEVKGLLGRGTTFEIDEEEALPGDEAETREEEALPY